MSHALRRHVVVLALAVTASLTACSDDQEDVGAPTPTPTAAPTATATGSPPEPVEGEVALDVRSVAEEPVVYSGGEAPDIDERAVRRFSGAVATWLDEHLTGLQAGEGGDLEAVAATGLIASGDARLVHAVTTALASPDRHVAHARYAFLVAATSRPEWLRATVVTETSDGDLATAQFVFVPGPGGPVLLAAGPAGEAGR